MMGEAGRWEGEGGQNKLTFDFAPSHSTSSSLPPSLMRLRSFSVAKVIPVEVIHLIIHESDSVSALKAWCLVSKGTLSVAGPILMREVVLTRSKDICPFLLHRVSNIVSILSSQKVLTQFHV